VGYFCARGGWGRPGLIFLARLKDYLPQGNVQKAFGSGLALRVEQAFAGSYGGCPPSLALGLPAFWVPLVAGLLMLATRPLFFILGAHPPCPLGGGCAPSTPLAHPRGLRVCQRFGSHSWAGLLMWRFVPFFENFGGTSPMPPGKGLRPLRPRFRLFRKLYFL
jgi:hypothetical protein